MNWEYYREYIDSNTKIRADTTPIFVNSKVFQNLLADLAKPFNSIKYDKIAGIDALGFIIGGALAQKKKVGFIPIRKGGKLPGKNVSSSSFVDYSKSKKTLEINNHSIKKGEKILLTDEWIETGRQIKSSIKLIEKLGGKVVGISVLYARKNNQTQILFDKYNLYAIKVVEGLSPLLSKK